MRSLANGKNPVKENSFNTGIGQIATTFKKQFGLQIMILTGLAFIVFFRFVPIYGLQMAFKEILPGKSIWESPWVGLKHFRDFFTSGYFGIVMRNTISLSLLKLCIGFPFPILFAVLLNEVASYRARSFVQGVSYLPHFISYVVVYGVISSLLGLNGGTLNSLLLSLGIIEKPRHFLASKSLFWPLMVFLDIWKETGWSAIIYMAAISGINPELYDAAKVDGAGRVRQVISITLPALVPVIVVMLILRVGSILDAGFDQLLVFRNPIVFEKSNILDIYVMDTGISQGRFGYATAVGLFKSAIGFFMVYFSNKLANKSGNGLW
jgi:putative aldouronate transport system permease protein